MSFDRIKRIIRKYNNLNLDKYNYKKVIIPKANGKLRSLGVSTPEWRIYQTGLNMILLVFTSIYQHPSQHGFIPNRGTDTAWKEIHSKIINKSNIFEFDLKEFFDRVQLDYLCSILQKMEIPSSLVYRLISWSREMPVNSDRSTDLSWSSEESKRASLTLHSQISQEETNQYKSQRKGDWENNYSYYHGVSQGSPLSPTLSTLLLIPILMLNKKVSSLFYADDGLLYSNSATSLDPQGLLNFSDESGIQAHLEEPKSKWIKRDGQWLTDKKFLGKRFEPYSLHPENKGLIHSQGGIIANATRTQKATNLKER